MEGECFMHYGFWLITRIILNAVITILTFLAIFVSVSEENKELVENEEITQLFNQTVRVKTYWMRRNILCSGVGLSLLAAGMLSSIWTVVGIGYYLEAIENENLCSSSTNREIMLVILLSLFFAAPMLIIIFLCAVLKVVSTLLAYNCPRMLLRCKRKFYGKLY